MAGRVVKIGARMDGAGADPAGEISNRKPERCAGCPSGAGAADAIHETASINTAAMRRIRIASSKVLPVSASIVTQM